MISTRLKHLLFIFALILPLFSFAKPIDDIIFMSENYPPYNFKKDNKVQGISVDILVLMLKKLKSKQSRKDIRILPWARGYHYLQKKPNTALFSTTRTQQREKLFKWVGPILSTRSALLAKKSLNIKIKSIDDIKQYKIGAVRDDIGEQILLNNGVPSTQIENVGGIDALYKLIKMLHRDRFEILSYEKNVGEREIIKMGFDINQYEVVYQFKKSSLYFAFHKDTSDDLISEFQNTLDEIKEDGQYQQIVNKYFK